MDGGEVLRENGMLVVSCEHAGNNVPDRWKSLFTGARTALDSHRGYDPGTLELGQRIADQFGIQAITTSVTRLLVDCNRSLGHRRLFSEWSNGLDRERRAAVLEEYYHPHRNRVEASIASTIATGGRIVHVGVHSFTPVWEGVNRNLDIGLLYDPARAGEKEFCLRWQQQLAVLPKPWRTRRNQPYLGKADGLVTYLRRRFGPDRYLGIELEVNQAIVLEGGDRWIELQRDLQSTLGQTLAA
jgi:predicted N-formylglutamate amidohydrolase